MNIQYRKATIEDLYEIMELIKFAVFTMENSGIYQWDEVYPDKSTIILMMNTKTVNGNIRMSIFVLYTGFVCIPIFKTKVLQKPLCSTLKQNFVNRVLKQ